ncbi:hypothetical protein AAXB25_14820 [Paenibacillus lautus]|uniref:hypothetical protein n=1 Tax=Paenibacillus lautus TaxID=1401 RepID=UPI003D29FFB2
MSEKEIVKNFEKNNMQVEVKVSYSLGGINWATGKQEARGYYLHVQPYTSEQREGYSMRTVTGFSGVKMLLLEVGRKSKNKLHEAVSMVTDEMIEEMVSYCKFDKQL